MKKIKVGMYVKMTEIDSVCHDLPCGTVAVIEGVSFDKKTFMIKVLETETTRQLVIRSNDYRIYDLSRLQMLELEEIL